MYYILELAELSKLNKQQGGDTYKKEHRATLELANAVGRKLKGAEGDFKALNKGCQIRLQQMADKGYLAVKRSKQDLHQLRPARYPGWEGRPRYGPTISFPMVPPPPAAKATAAPHKPKSVKPSPAESKRIPPAAAASTASPSLQTSRDLQSKPASAAAKQVQPTAAGSLPPSSQTPTPTPQTAPSSAATVASVLALPPASSLQQATATANTQQQQQPLLSGTTAALVAAVGPLFESFVAQTAAVATDPSVSLQTLTGSITQQLAAAIANAAVQVVAQRQQQLTPTSGPSSAHVPLSQAAALTTSTNALVPAEGSEPAVVGFTPVDHVSGSSSKNVSVDTSNEGKSVAIRDSKEGQTHCDDEAPRSDKADAHNDGSSKVAFTSSDGGHTKHAVASTDVAVTPEVDHNKKRASSNGKDQHSSGEKRQKTGAQPLEGGMTSQGHVVPSKHASRSDTSTSDRAPRSSVGRQAKGHKGSGRGSPGSRGSRGSFRSSPKDMGPIDAASRSHIRKAASPQPVGRNNLGPAFQHSYGAGPALLPSRLSGHFKAGSPMTSIPLSFVPNAPNDLDFRPSNAYTDVVLSPQAGLANGFMPLMPTSPGNWHMPQPALNNFPLAAQFLPGVDKAPDFSPVN